MSAEGTRTSYLTVPQQHRLNDACLGLVRAFKGNHPYHVGSSAMGGHEKFHDVDVRMMLDDKEFKRMFRRRSWLLLANSAISHQLELATGLPIDFQFQDTTQANEEFGGKFRNPLGMPAFPAPKETA